MKEKKTGKGVLCCKSSALTTLLAIELSSITVARKKIVFQTGHTVINAEKIIFSLHLFIYPAVQSIIMPTSFSSLFQDKKRVTMVVKREKDSKGWAELSIQS